MNRTQTINYYRSIAHDLHRFSDIGVSGGVPLSYRWRSYKMAKRLSKKCSKLWNKIQEM